MANGLMVMGLVIVALGLLLQYWPQSLAWFGHLPGDIRYQTPHVLIVLPFTSMALISGVLSLILYGLRG